MAQLKNESGLYPESLNGNNSLGAKDLYRQRNLYKNSFPTVDLPPAFSFWNSLNVFYGRMDHEEDAIIISEVILKQVQAEQTIFLVHFVADAFEEFRQYVKKNITEGKYFPIADQLTRLEPAKGWTSVGQIYDGHIKNLYDLFVGSYLEELGRKYKVVDFNTFLAQFINFTSTLGPDLPLTRTSFMMTKYFDPLVSGLCVEIASADHGNDSVKYEQYIKNPNFGVYVQAASNFGFTVDMNAPWRLVANMNSPNMRKFMKKYYIEDHKQLFNNFYYKSYAKDIDMLKFYLYNMYKTYISAYPEVSIPGISPASCNLEDVGARQSYRAKDKLVKRQPLEGELFEQIYDSKFWLTLYAFFRFQEKNLDGINIKKKKKVIHKALSINKTLDFETALKYINDYVKLK